MSTDPLQPLMIKRKVRAAQLVLLNKARQAQSRKCEHLRCDAHCDQERRSSSAVRTVQLEAQEVAAPIFSSQWQVTFHTSVGR